MIARFGNVVYWLGCSFAVIMAVFAILFLSSGDGQRQDWYIGFSMLAGMSLIFWLVGRAARYVLAGK